MNAPETPSEIRFSMGTLSFKKVPRTVSVEIILQQGVCRDNRKIGDKTRLALFWQRIAKSLIQKRRVKIQLSKLKGWNLAVAIKPVFYTAVIFTKYRPLKDSEATQESQVFFQFRMMPADADSLNKRIDYLKAKKRREDRKELRREEELKAFRTRATMVIPCPQQSPQPAPVPVPVPKTRFAKGLQTVSAAISLLVGTIGLSLKTKP